MNKWIIIAAVVVVLALGGGYVAYSSMSDTEKATGTEATESKTNGKENDAASISELLAKGKPTKCTFENESQNWTVYVDGQKFRGDYVMTDEEGTTMGGHTINDGEYVYIWSDEEATKVGMKMKMTDVDVARESAEATTDTASLNNSIQETVDYDEAVDMDCNSWKADSTQFTPPTNITFTDFAQQLGATGANLEALREETCKACDSLDGESKDECIAQLNCK